MASGIGDRITQWGEQRVAAWKDRLAGWAVDIAVRGVRKSMEDLEPEAAEIAHDVIGQIRKVPGLPPELKTLLDEMANPKHPIPLLLLLPLLIATITSLGGIVFKGFLEPFRQQAEKTTPFHIPDLGVALDMRLRGKMEDTEFYDIISRAGWSAEWADRFLDLKHPVLPSDLALRAWLRDKPKYQKYVDNLPKLGLTSSDIELLTELEYRIPGVQDIIRYVVKEAYSPEIYREFGQDQEYPAIAEADAEKAGIRPDQLMKEWIAHWELPGITQGYEMLHRGIITQDQLRKLQKARDIMPFWRDGLEAIAWNIPNRIELRLMARYGLVDKAYLVDALGKGGLAEEYRDTVADMNLVLGIRTDLQTRYGKGWITADDVAAELASSGMSQPIQERVYQYIVVNESANRTVKQKDLTLAQIVKGIKKGKIDRAQGIDLVMDVGYDGTEARLILDIEAPADETDAAVKARELTKADILAGLKTRTITLSTARAKLVSSRYVPADADYILKVYQASIKPPTAEKAKELTRSDIEKAVKLGLIPAKQAYTMLLAIGYTPAAADFILKLRAEADTPETQTRLAELTRADILGGLKTGILTEDQAVELLLAMPYSPEDAAYIVNLYQASIKVPEPSPPKQYTRADVISAVKQGLVTPEQGFQLLLDIGYTEDSAAFILSVQATSSPFSPYDYGEFKQLTGLVRQARGIAAEDLPAGAQELQLAKARAVAEGRNPVLEQLRIQIDTVRRRRRAGALTRDQELAELQKLSVPAEYIAALVANDDARLETSRRKTA